MYMKNFRTLAIWTAALLAMLGASALAQTDSGVRGGTQNTAGYLQYRGIPIPHPPVISPHPTTGATITANELGPSTKESIEPASWSRPAPPAPMCPMAGR